MAESSLQDVALNTQSAGDNSPSDAPATTTDTKPIGGDAGEGIVRKENGVGLHDHMFTKVEDHGLEDGAIRSDEDTSRDNSVTGDTRSTDVKPTKKFVASKPISFAKYSVPKSSTVNAPPKAVVDKAPAPAAINTFSTPIGRSRLVAKTANANQQKPTGYKPTAPDPMQVWNKNRATPQPSTKHLTDEELKQQYGIHLTSRLQSDGEGKEAKWADIDDDEDDWAPETIEWNDGTKTTVNPADPSSSKQNLTAGATPMGSAKSVTAPKPVGHQYSSSVGPNATVLKLGASAERQQAQRALAQQHKGPSENPPTSMSKASPAPAPAKSPWAKLPEIDKISPVAINPQTLAPVAGHVPLVGPQPPRYTGQASPPAKEISADDFNRSWRSSPSSQTRELFMPSSGRYETVGDGKRRMSKNEQNFRAPAVLQRPSQRDARTPAEPSPAFQTRRTSIDQGRRRASSSISGGSGQFASRMSFKSTDTANVSQPDAVVQQPPAPGDSTSPSTQTPTYQAHIGNVSGQPDTPSDVDLDAQRLAQKALMKEKIENARQRKLEEEQRLEAEKQERIKLKLASLGPPPEPVKPKQEDIAQEKRADAPSVLPQAPMSALPVQSPPKPPQPHATGEPQQYGMMTVHPLDSVKRLSLPDSHAAEPTKPASEPQSTTQQSATDKLKLPSPAMNDVRSAADGAKSTTDDVNISEPSSRFGRPPPSVSSDARAGWGATRNEHRSQQTGNLWGLPSNKALGNGTFDQSLAGYSPQDLSRTSSTGQGWMNGRTPTVGQSPQLTHANQHVPETRSHLIQSMISPEPQPLNINSEVDSALPASRPAPIGRPQVPGGHNQTNGLPVNTQATGLTAWNNFQHVARTQERAETEKFNRELSERREEEKRTGIRPQASYGLQETFKQVQLGEQVGQRHVSHITQTSHVPNSMFSAVGLPPTAEPPSRLTNGNTGRGSRFFPQQTNGVLPQERRSVTYSHPEPPRTPSPPPAEEYASLHPAFDGDHIYPKVHFPRERAVVRLPPAAPLPPPPPPPPAQKERHPPSQPEPPMTWAARVQMPAPIPARVPTSVRAVSTPLVDSGWQEKINGLFLPAKQQQPQQQQQNVPRTQPAPALASSREPLDILPGAPAASVSLPRLWEADELDTGKTSSKDVEDEEDLFEDREAGSLPTVHLPRDTPLVRYSLVSLPRGVPAVVDPSSIPMFMVSNWSEKHGHAKPQYALIKAPGSGKAVRKDLPFRNSSVITPPTRSRNSYGSKTHTRPKPATKARPASKAH